MNVGLHLPLFSPLWFLTALAGFAGGYGAGLVHFRLLRTVADRLLHGDWTAAAVQMLRLAALAAVLGLATLAGAQALIAATAGIVVARNRVLAQSGAHG